MQSGMYFLQNLKRLIDLCSKEVTSIAPDTQLLETGMLVLRLIKNLTEGHNEET